MEEKNNVIEEKEGSFIIGFLLGLFLDIIGVTIAYSACKYKTKRGAFYGFISFVLIVVIVVVFVLVFNKWI